MKIHAFGDRVIVRALEPEQGAVIIPDTVQEKPKRGEVLSVGDTPEVGVGDEVFYSPYSATEIKYGHEQLLILREGDLLAKRVA